MGPLLFSTNYISPIWSGARINEVRGLGKEPLYGEGFDLTAHRGMVTNVKGGPFDGVPLDQLIAEHHDEIVGDLPDMGVVQTLLLSASEVVSVQVHPDEAYAQAHEDDREKDEAWYVLEAEPNATLIAGSLTDDIEALRAAAADDTIGNTYGRQVGVSEGDLILIPAGTLHAFGPGIFAVELSTLGFTTYRLCDWGRGRELHVEKGFDVLDVSPHPSPVSFGRFSHEGPTQVRTGVNHRLLSIDVVDVRDEWGLDLESVYRVITAVAGDAEIETPDGSAHLPYTHSALIPASARHVDIKGPCRVLCSRAR